MRLAVITALLAVAACAPNTAAPVTTQARTPGTKVTTAAATVATTAAVATTTAPSSSTSAADRTSALPTTSGPASPATTVLLPAQPVIETRVIGQSVGGRSIVAMHKPGSDHATRRILVIGQIHGEEPAGRGVVTALVSMHIPESVDLWMISTVNPDGGAIGRRTNNHGVDLNRNFPADWQPPGGPNTSAQHNSGPAPGSEPETKAAMTFIASIRPDVTIWYHQPYHWVDCDLSVAAAVCRPYAARVGYAIAHQQLPGTAIDWQTQQGYGLAFVVEFGYGSATSASLARHAAAAVSL